MNSEILRALSHDSVGETEEMLQFFLYECSIDQAPERTEVAQWRDILQQRGGRFSRLAALCQNWLDEEQEAHPV